MRNKCPACCHTDTTEVYRWEKVSLYRCNTCGLILNSNHMNGFDPITLYQNYYRNEMPGKFYFGVEHLIRAFRFLRTLKIFSICPNAKSILDIGCGRGFTIYYLKKYYRYERAAGTQIAKSAYEFSRNKLGLEVYNKELLDLPFKDEMFDVVTMWHVLEHVAHPEQHIKKIYSLLKDRGTLIIEVPNFNSWLWPLTNRYWLNLDPTHHVSFFTPQSLAALLEKYNFKVTFIYTFSFEYSTFISAQSLISFFTKTDHLLFHFFQNGGFSRRLVPHFILLLFLSPICFLINLALIFSKRGEVLFIAARKQ